jgi:hypothetical protein
MSKLRTGKKTADFGRRGSDKAAPVVRKPTSMERLKTMGRQWWSKNGPQKKKPQPKARKAARS